VKKILCIFTFHIERWFLSLRNHYATPATWQVEIWRTAVPGQTEQIVYKTSSPQINWVWYHVSVIPEYIVGRSQSMAGSRQKCKTLS
jgi:hypothetical protein